MDVRYPIGPFQRVEAYTAEQLEQWINTIAKLPRELNEHLQHQQDDALNVTYRQGGWSVRDIVHHLADSHVVAYMRMKLALTEHAPTVTLYDEQRWSELNDYNLPVHVSLTLLGALHMRWVELMRSITPDDLQRTFIHPEHGALRVADIIALYAWHSEHHLAHIKLALHS